MTEFARSKSEAFLEARRSCQEVSCYRPHSHDTLSLGLIVSGSARLTGSVAGPVDLQAGDVIVIPAHHVHACNPSNGKWEYQMLHVEEAWFTALDPELSSALLAHGVSVIREPLSFEAALAAVNAVFAGSAENQLIEAMQRVLATLSGTTPQRCSSEKDQHDAGLLDPALERLLGDEQNPRIDDLAELVGMNRYGFIRAMKRATGLSPLAWRQNAKINLARHLLRAGNPISETAISLGFSDQSHLHRVFRSHVAASPGSYREAQQ